MTARKNRNSVLYDSGCGLGVREHSFMVWPSIGLRLNPEGYMAAVTFLSNASDVHFDGSLIIIPEEDTALREAIESRFEVLSVERKSEERQYQNGFGDEYATKAIQRGVDPYLVVLGDCVSGLVGSADNMLEKAINEPEKTKIYWKNVYLSSMSEQ
jgi:hypothetical protein